MALIDCPECNNKISEQAESCPECGYPINNKQESDDPGIYPLGCFGWVGIFIFANIIGVILGVIVLVVTNDSEYVKNPDALALFFGTGFTLCILGRIWWMDSQAKNS
jgi:hypothetical protein